MTDAMQRNLVNEGIGCPSVNFTDKLTLHSQLRDFLMKSRDSETFLTSIQVPFMEFCWF